MERLAFSARETRMVARMVEHHLRPSQMGSDGGLPTRRAIYRYFRDTEDVGLDTLFLNLADHLATRGPRLNMKAWREHCEATAYVISSYFEEQALITPPKLVDGRDIMQAFGLGPGPLIGQLLQAVREAQAAGEVTTREEALAYVKKLLMAEKRINYVSF